MKINFFKVLVFIFIVVFFDRIIGYTCKELYEHSNDFYIHKLRYSLDSTWEDVLILGSSRAEHHFVSKIIEQNIGLTAYNCGVGGEELFFSLIIFQISLKRHKPKLIIVEVSPSSLFIPEVEEKMKLLLPVYKKDTLIFNALTNGNMFARLKFLSSIYPYNSTIASLLKGCFKRSIDTLGGFHPLYAVFDTTGVAKKNSVPMFLPQQKLFPLEQLVTLCNHNNIKVAVVNSPVYSTNSSYEQVSNQIKKVCSQYDNVYYFDYSKYKNVYNQREFFKDNTHLNYTGAKIFTQAITNELRKIIL